MFFFVPTCGNETNVCIVLFVETVSFTHEKKPVGQGISYADLLLQNNAMKAQNLYEEKIHFKNRVKQNFKSDK